MSAYYQKGNKRYKLSQYQALGLRTALRFKKKEGNVVMKTINPDASDIGEDLIGTYKVSNDYGIWISTPGSVPSSFEMYDLQAQEAGEFIQGLLAGSREVKTSWESMVYGIYNKKGKEVMIPHYKQSKILFVHVKSEGDDEFDKDPDNENLFWPSTIENS